MNKKYILSKAIFASVLAAGLLAGTLAFAQTASNNSPATTNAASNSSTVTTGPGNNTQGNGQNLNAPAGAMRYGNGATNRGSFGRIPVASFGRGGSSMRGAVTSHRSTGMIIWSTIARLITMILLWVIMVQVIILLFWKIRSHTKQKQ